MVERSRRRQEMNDTTTTARMLMATAALAAVGALFAGAANAKPVDIDGGSASAAVTTKAAEPMTIPYLSHGIGVDESLYSGQTLTGVHAALQHSRSTAGESTVPPGLSGDSASTRVSAPEPVRLGADPVSGHGHAPGDLRRLRARLVVLRDRGRHGRAARSRGREPRPHDASARRGGSPVDRRPRGERNGAMGRSPRFRGPTARSHPHAAPETGDARPLRPKYD